MQSFILATISAVVDQRLSQIMRFCVSVHRLSAMGSPARLMTASNADISSIFETESKMSISSPSSACALSLFLETTVNLYSFWYWRMNSLPIRPVPPVTRIFIYILRYADLLQESIRDTESEKRSA